MVNALRYILIVLVCCSCRKPSGNPDHFAHLELPAFSKHQLEEDFDLLVSSLKEAHTGLYWYTTAAVFDSLVHIQRRKLIDSIDALQFYNRVAPVIAATREDHCDLYLSDEVSTVLANRGRFLPLIVVNLDKTFIVNNVNNFDTKGAELVAVNDTPIRDIHQQLFNTFASDGFIITSKYRYLDFHGFSREYAKVFVQQKENSITVRHPGTDEERKHVIESVSYEQLGEISKRCFEDNTIRKEIERPGQMKIKDDSTAVLTFTTFSNRKFREYNMEFEAFVDSCFRVISEHKIGHIILDMRDNGGGSEGNEDYLFSYLTGKPYHKYKYVQTSALSFSFLEFTDYASPEDQKELEAELKEEHVEVEHGTYYRKPGLYISAPVRKDFFRGRVYVLISGWTYSGGAEFSTLMREHTDAVFIGEETGGGYYGNTSGTILEFTLPNTKLTVDIPILKFALDVTKGEFGRGVIPDHSVQPTFDEFITGYDAEMEFALAWAHKSK